MRDETREGEGEGRRCSAKIPYSTRKVALAAIARNLRHGLAAQRAYHCPICRKWHLTSKPLREAAS